LQHFAGSKQVMPHDPQFVSSYIRSTHSPLQQTAGSKQVIPQEPQFSSSKLRFVHLPLQFTAPAPQEATAGWRGIWVTLWTIVAGADTLTTDGFIVSADTAPINRMRKQKHVAERNIQGDSSATGNKSYGMK
jgi:hypothetical protein